MIKHHGRKQNLSAGSNYVTIQRLDGEDGQVAAVIYTTKHSIDHFRPLSKLELKS